MNDIMLSALLEAKAQRENPDELIAIEQYKRGNELRSVVTTEAWAVICDTLKQYADRAVEDLLSLVPGDPHVTTAHAAASALVQQFKIFKEDIERAVEDSYQVPDAIRRISQ